MTNTISPIQNHDCPSMNPIFSCSVGNPSIYKEELSFASQGRIYEKNDKKTNVGRKWDNDDDSLLMSLLSTNNDAKQSWNSIAMHINGKVGKQCRERWLNQLRPCIKKDPWDEKEDEILVKYHKMYGNRWAKISKFIQGRPDNSIKNHFNAAKRKLFTNKFHHKAGQPVSPVLRDYLRGLYECTYTPNSNTIIAPSAASLSSMSSITYGNIVESSSAHQFEDVASNESSPSTVVSSSHDDDEFMNNVCQYVDQMKESFDWMEDV